MLSLNKTTLSVLLVLGIFLLRRLRLKFQEAALMTNESSSFHTTMSKLLN